MLQRVRRSIKTRQILTYIGLHPKSLPKPPLSGKRFAMPSNRFFQEVRFHLSDTLTLVVDMLEVERLGRKVA